MKNILLILIILVQTINAQKIVAVLEITPTNTEEAELTIQEFRHLTDELRTQARTALQRNAYTILTRDNIFQLLPPDEEEADCLAASCAVEIGRAIGAEYVTQGFVGKFEGQLTLTIELYESMSGNLISSFVTESKTASGLLGTIREKAPELFGKLSLSPEPAVRATLAVAPPAIAQNPIVQTDKKFHQTFDKDSSDGRLISSGNYPSLPAWVAVTFDILGAAAIGFGIYQHINSNNLYKDYKKPPTITPSTPEEFNTFDKKKNAELKKANDAERLRNIGLAIGGGLLAVGIGVHIWF